MATRKPRSRRQRLAGRRHGRLGPVERGVAVAVPADRRVRLPVGLPHRLVGRARRFGGLVVRASVRLAERVRHPARPRGGPFRFGPFGINVPSARQYEPGTNVLVDDVEDAAGLGGGARRLDDGCQHRADTSRRTPARRPTTTPTTRWSGWPSASRDGRDGAGVRAGVHRHRDVGEQDDRIVVAVVDADPRHMRFAAFGPLRQQRRLAVAGWGDHRDHGRWRQRRPAGRPVHSERRSRAGRWRTQLRLHNVERRPG